MHVRTLTTSASLLGSFMLFTTSAHAQSVLYVDVNATGPTHDGSSWCNAFLYLQDALAAAEASGGTVMDVRVADGVYKPDRDEANPDGTGDREATFQLLNGVEIYGGFAGCGAPDPDERNIAWYETILSGDLNGNDLAGGDTSDCCYEHPTPGCDDAECEAAVCEFFGDFVDCCGTAWEQTCADVAAGIPECAGLCNTEIEENSYHVVDGSYTGPTAVLDGFAVTAGNANGVPLDANMGGGIANFSGSPTVRSCTFRRNYAKWGGAGMSNVDGANPSVTDCLFIANVGLLAAAGVGMYNHYSNPSVVNCAFVANMGPSGFSFGAGIVNVGSHPTIVNCAFAGNSAFLGGAMFNDVYSSPTVINCRFTGNTATEEGGGMINNYSYPIVANCLFTGNSAWRGGAMWNIRSAPTLVNCTMSGNSALESGGGVYNASLTDPILTNCVLWGNSDGSGTGESAQIYSEDFSSVPVVNYSCVQGGWSGAGGLGVISSDPKFVGADGDNLRLLPGSPCIDAGDNDAVPEDGVDLDNDGNTTEPIPVDLDWLARFRDDSTPDTGNPGAPGPPIVDMGAYENHPDCNENGLPDLLDLAHGTSEDCNDNGIPDECDIAEGTSRDLDRNGIPDECQEQFVPAVSVWGLIVLALLLLTSGKIFFNARRQPRQA